jgi:Na+-translocating ferredoxin:NAD+ oxidoreductase RnfD subunit
MSIGVVPYPATMVPSSSRPTRFLRTPKGLLSLVFLPLLLLGGLAEGRGVVLHVLSAVAGACLIDLIATRLDRRIWHWPSSAILSGLIVAFVLEPQQPWLVALAVGALANASRQIIVTRRGHIFNPAALALLVSIPLFGAGQSWWGALVDLPWPFMLVLLAGGAVVIDRVNKWPLVLAFAATYFGLFTAVAPLNPGAVAEMFRTPFIQAALFFACFMLTDPPTSPARYTEQIWIGILVATVSVVAQLTGFGQAYLLLGILAGNVLVAGRRWLMAPSRPL